MVSVVVGCAVPNGVKLRLHAEHDEQEVTPTGYRAVKVWRPTGEVLVLGGNAGELAKNDPRSPLGFGYRLHSLTGKDAELFIAWTKQQGKNNYLIDSKALIWHESAEHVEEQAEDLVKQGIKTGLEPLDPNDPPREFRRVKVAEEQTFKPAAKEVPPFIHHQRQTVERKQRILRHANGNNPRLRRPQV
jgi:hypothetical protein